MKAIRIAASVLAILLLPGAALALSLLLAGGNDFETFVMPNGENSTVDVVGYEEGVTILGPTSGAYVVDVTLSAIFEFGFLFDANLMVENGITLPFLYLHNSSYYGSIALGSSVDSSESFVSNAFLTAGNGTDLSSGIFEFATLTGGFTGVDIRFSTFFGADLSAITSFDAFLWGNVTVDPTTYFGGNTALQALVTVDPGLTATTTSIAPEPGTALLVMGGLVAIGLARRKQGTR